MSTPRSKQVTDVATTVITRLGTFSEGNRGATAPEYLGKLAARAFRREIDGFPLLEDKQHKDFGEAIKEGDQQRLIQLARQVLRESERAEGASSGGRVVDAGQAPASGSIASPTAHPVADHAAPRSRPSQPDGPALT